MRIFTGAPLPEGADRVVIQEDVARDGDVGPERDVEADVARNRERRVERDVPDRAHADGRRPERDGGDLEPAVGVGRVAQEPAGRFDAEIAPLDVRRALFDKEGNPVAFDAGNQQQVRDLHAAALAAGAGFDGDAR